MMEKNDDSNCEAEESFADLFELYTSGMNENIQVGDKIQGEIISVGQDSVFIDTGTKIDGAVDKVELLDDDDKFPFTLGDTVELYVVAMDEREIKLSKAITGIGGLNLLHEAYAGAIPIEGIVQETCKGGFRVDVMQRRAFCPISQIDLKFVEDPEAYVGKTFPFLIIQLENRGKNIVISRRKLLEVEQGKIKKRFFEEIEEGAIIDGIVTRVMPYGAFIELVPGVEGMAHISELSWARIENPEDALHPGDALRVKVIKIDQSEQSKPPKIGLSIKQVSDNPWNMVNETFVSGEKVEGKVTRCMKFGAFVEIAPGIEGLVHISEMSYVKRVLKPEDIVTKGEVIHVLIKEIDTQNRRISLSIKDAEGDPWVDISKNFTIGTLVQGTLERKEKFGYFINLAPGITGLLPKSKITRASNATSIDKLKPGNRLMVHITEIDLKTRKMTLAPADAGDADDWRKFVKKEDAYVSTLGEKLKRAFDSKK